MREDPNGFQVRRLNHSAKTSRNSRKLIIGALVDRNRNHNSLSNEEVSLALRLGVAQLNRRCLLEARSLDSRQKWQHLLAARLRNECGT